MKLSIKLPRDILTSSPSRLQEETWMIDGVLTYFLMLDLDESFSKASLGYFYTLTTSSSGGGELENMWILEKLLDV